MASNDVSLKVTADASQAKKETKEVEKGLDDVGKSAKKAEDAGKAAANGLRSGLMNVVLAMGPLIAAFATLKAARALVDIADQAIEADNKIARLAGRTKDVQPTISGAFTEIKNAVVLFARSVNDGTGVVGAIGRVMSEVAQVIAIFAKTMFGAGTEADRLKNRQGAIEFAQNVGRWFAYLGDVVKALARDFIGLREIGREVFVALGETIGGIGAMIKSAARGDFVGVKAIWDEMGVMADAAAARIKKTFNAGLEETAKAFRHQGEAYLAYVESLASGARILLASPEDSKKKDQGDGLDDVDVYRRKMKDPLAGSDKLEPVDVYRHKMKDPLAKGGWPDFLPTADMMQNALDTLFNMQQTWAEKLRGIWTSLASHFTQQLITKPLSDMVMRQIRESALYKSMFAQQVASQAAASTATTGIKAGEATAVVGANAAEAASGAAASQSSIPYIGWALAAAAFASVFAMVMGAKSSIKSAAGGFDIPSGLNPVTQLHAEEMVLPADIANPLRDSLSGGGGPAPSIELKGVSAGEFFIASRKELLAVLRSARREFAL